MSRGQPPRAFRLGPVSPLVPSLCLVPSSPPFCWALLLLCQFDAFIVTGSRHDAHSSAHWVLSLCALIQRVVARRRQQLLGVCYGHQVLCRKREGGGEGAGQPRQWEGQCSCVPSLCFLSHLLPLAVWRGRWLLGLWGASLVELQWAGRRACARSLPLSLSQVLALPLSLSQQWGQREKEKEERPHPPSRLQGMLPVGSLSPSPPCRSSAFSPPPSPSWRCTKTR